MPITGRKPKPEDQRRNRTKPVHDWVEVADVPYSGPRPGIGRAAKATRDWWEAVSTMPHCILWTPADWQFALEASRLHGRVMRGDMRAEAALFKREKVMGATLDFLRDLRIRYVEPGEEVSEDSEGIMSLADYRMALGDE